MDPQTLKARVEALIAVADTAAANPASASRLTQGTITVLRSAYGPDSAQEAELNRLIKVMYSEFRPNLVGLKHTLSGVLQNLKEELEGGLVGSIRAQATGEVLSDFIALARQTLEEPNDGAKNVAAVLAAAAFEDALRRLAAKNAIPHFEKLADVHAALKDAELLKGAQIATSQSYLTFRNRALHAQWQEVDRSVTHSVIAFTEQLLLQHFV